MTPGVRRGIVVVLLLAGSPAIPGASADPYTFPGSEGASPPASIGSPGPGERDGAARSTHAPDPDPAPSTAGDSEHVVAGLRMFAAAFLLAVSLWVVQRTRSRVRRDRSSRASRGR